MRFLSSPIGFSTSDIAVDLGTANTVLCAHRHGLVVSEPSIVAVDARTHEPLAAGREALEILGRDGIAGIRPLKDGAIVDLQAAAEMLRHLIGRVGQHSRARPCVVATASSGISAVQRRAVAEACLAAGARETHLIAKSLAAALGTGLPVHEPIGTMVLDIGASTSEVAMISMRAIVASQTIPVGGQEFDQRIVAHLKRAHHLLIAEQTAEQIKIQVGSARPDEWQAQVEVLGRDLASGMHKSVRLTSQEIRDTLERPIARIVEATKDTLARTPPQLAGDVIDRGITLTGGSSLLRGLAERLRLETGIPTRVANAARACIAIGAARSLDRQPTRPYLLIRLAVPRTISAAR